MPRIRLKPNSAEYEDAEEAKKPHTFGCDMPGCPQNAEFKAPKDRSLNEYYRFCLEHVQEYNRAWNYFSGMGQADIEDYIVRSSLGDRPTWRYDTFAGMEDNLRDRVWQTYHYTDKQPPKDERGYKTTFETSGPEHEAMAVMGLEPPLSLQGIKTRYKELVKKHHPDINRDDPESGELLKRINMAYTILRLAYEKYDKLEK